MKSLDGEAGTSAITDHPFKPVTLWWSRCKVCGLSEAAHTETEAKPYKPDTFRCTDCVTARDFGRRYPHAEGECPR